MKTIYYNICIIVFLTLTLTGCDTYLSYKTNTIRIVAMDSIEVESINNENRIPAKIRLLCDVLEFQVKEQGKQAIQAFLLQPILNRIDLGQELSMKTGVKTFSGNKDNPKVLGKHIKKNFEETLIVPESLSLKTKMNNSELNNTLNKYLSNNLGKDSLIIFSEKESFFKIGRYSYKTFSDVEEIRKYMLSILKKNAKASFCVLWNPILPGVSDEKVVINNKFNKESKVIPLKTINREDKSDRIIISPAKVEYREVTIKHPKKEKWIGEGKSVNEVKNGTINGEEAKSKQ